MRQCPECEYRNPDSNKFCSHCGAPLEPQQPAPLGVDPEKSARLLDLAFQLSDEGRLSDAIQVCQQAVAANPASTSAHSLLGILYERAGQREQAILEYERALALSPDSTADRESLQQLKGTAARPVPAPRAVRYGVIAALGVLAVAMLAQIVITLAKPAAQQPSTAAVSPYSHRAGMPVEAMQERPAPPTTPIVIVPPPDYTSAPIPQQAPGTEAPKPTVRIAPVTVPEAPPAPAPAPSAPPAPEPVKATPAPPKISPPPALAHNEHPENAVSQATLVGNARNYYFAKDYDSAIKCYQQALANDAGSPAYVHEELAWCYHQTNRMKEAKAEYRRALESYLRELAKGENMAEATHGMSTCEAALRALEGN